MPQLDDILAALKEQATDITALQTQSTSLIALIGNLHTDLLNLQTSVTDPAVNASLTDILNGIKENTANIVSATQAQAQAAAANPVPAQAPASAPAPAEASSAPSAPPAAPAA